MVAPQTSHHQISKQRCLRPQLLPPLFSGLRATELLWLSSPSPTLGMGTQDGQVVSGRVGEFPSVGLMGMAGAPGPRTIWPEAWGWLKWRFSQPTLPHSVSRVCSWSRME